MRLMVVVVMVMLRCGVVIDVFILMESAVL